MSSPDRQGQSGPQPPAADPAKPQGAAAGVQVGIKRQGNVVDIVLPSHDDYAAIKLSDHLVRSMREGNLRLDIGRTPGTTLQYNRDS